MNEPCKWEKALHSLTPGGSEYVNDLPRMLEWIRRRQSHDHEMVVKAVKEQKETRARLEQSEKARKELAEALEAALPRIAHYIGCLTLNPTEMWDMEQYNEDRCHCERATVKTALANNAKLEAL